MTFSTVQDGLEALQAQGNVKLEDLLKKQYLRPLIVSLSLKKVSRCLFACFMFDAHLLICDSLCIVPAGWCWTPMFPAVCGS